MRSLHYLGCLQTLTQILLRAPSAEYLKPDDLPSQLREQLPLLHHLPLQSVAGFSLLQIVTLKTLLSLLSLRTAKREGGDGLSIQWSGLK